MGAEADVWWEASAFGDEASAEGLVEERDIIEEKEDYCRRMCRVCVRRPVGASELELRGDYDGYKGVGEIP